MFVSVWADDVLIGGPAEHSGREKGKTLAAELTRCGIKTRYTDDIEAALWGKVLYNVGLNPLSAILEVPYGELGLQEDARDLLVNSIREAFRVACRETPLAWKDESTLNAQKMVYDLSESYASPPVTHAVPQCGK